jgi:predicted RNase H-like HicB family nuclease
VATDNVLENAAAREASMRRRYTVILEKEESGGYHVFCPALPGCHSEGDSLDDAMKAIREAIEAYVESLVAHGEKVPEESEIIVAHAEIGHAETATV